MARFLVLVSLFGCTDLVFPGEPDIGVAPDDAPGCLDVTPAVLNFSVVADELPATDAVQVSDLCGIPHTFTVQLDDPEGAFQAQETLNLDGVDPVALPVTFAPADPRPGARFEAQLLLMEEETRMGSVQLGAVVEVAE
jgi:hypothetical protein